jgi:hypothetical protein
LWVSTPPVTGRDESAIMDMAILLGVSTRTGPTVLG